MKYRIIGVSKKTGDEVDITIEESSKEAAEKTAYSMDIVVYTSKTREVLEETNPPLRRATRIVEQQDSPIQDSSEHNQNNPLPTLNVNVKSNSNSLGIASIVLGILAFLICWIPFVGIFGLLLGCLGGILALVGLILSLRRSGAGIGYPIAGLAINGLSVGVAFLITSAIVGAVTELSEISDSYAPPNLTPNSSTSSDKLKSTEIIYVTLSNKRLKEQDFIDHMWFDVSFNPANLLKPTRAVKGTFVFADLFDDVHFRVTYTIDDPLNPNTPHSVRGIGLDYNQFMDSHRWLNVTNLDDMKIWFQVDSIIYKDGERQDF